MKGKTIAGLALLLGIVMVGAFISGCIDQGNATETGTKTGGTTSQPTTTSPDISEEEKYQNNLLKAIATYDAEIVDIESRLKPSTLSGLAEETKALERDATHSTGREKTLLLEKLAYLKSLQLAELRNLIVISAVETAYWENATTGEPIEGFYREDGKLFIVDNGKMVPLSRDEMVARMMELTKGYETRSMEIYHFGSGSLLQIREGGRTVGAGQLAVVRISVPKKGFMIQALGDSPGIMRLIDPGTGRTVLRVKPDGNGVYQVPPVNTTLVGIADDEGFCYRPLPLDSNTMNTIPEEPEDPLICPSPGLAPFIFEPGTRDVTVEPVPFEDAYLTGKTYGGITFELAVAPLGMLGRNGTVLLVGVPENGTGIRVLSNSSKPGVMVLMDPKTGREIDRITPDKKGIYRIPGIDGEVIGFVAKADPPNGGFCYRPLELNINTTLEPMEICEEEFTMMPIIFEPSTNETFEPVSSQRADLKQLAEQLVNFRAETGRFAAGATGAGWVRDAPVGERVNDIRGVTPMKTGEYTAFRMERGNTAPFLKGILGDFGTGPFNPAPLPEFRYINVTDFGTGPFIPPVELAVMDSGGEVFVAVAGPAMTSKMPPEYLGGTFLEVWTGRNPQTGKEISVIALKVLDENGKVSIRAMTVVRDKPVRIGVFAPGNGGSS
ncbi:hypothetical protein [Thermococcus thioreducens]|uniref:Uncharacterized protein n=1 Tax=Thermococcus thioreducens TaxID=277988 RepID=A0A0Q2S3I8_9EURY|nr:hypothetical protein [Thermococcus thioreducens]ASJ12678.1 hypothetical protein A3L14_07170 [Thermococcus thioreducens]KQH82011.1 hypothetical protein AMR53_07945 [Thermococcus thioreducens]SEV86846.1 hypothetical protein SAMN05216170_0515 [Thermococcus thioreducens]